MGPQRLVHKIKGPSASDKMRESLFGAGGGPEEDWAAGRIAAAPVQGGGPAQGEQVGEGGRGTQEAAGQAFSARQAPGPR